jgi:hypothetical protein
MEWFDHTLTWLKSNPWVPFVFIAIFAYHELTRLLDNRFKRIEVLLERLARQIEQGGERTIYGDPPQSN